MFYEVDLNKKKSIISKRRLTYTPSKLESHLFLNKDVTWFSYFYFSNESLIFISKKYANKVGDLRPALEICKTIILDHLKEIKNKSYTVTLKEIIMRVNKTNNSFIELLANLTLEQKIVIASIYLILTKSKKTEFRESEVI